MQRVVIALVLALVIPCGGASAESSIKDKTKFCASFGSLAEAIMKRRQSGDPPSELMEKVDQTDASAKLIVRLITEAYAVRRYLTEEGQLRAIQDFRADNETTCFESIK